MAILSVDDPIRPYMRVAMDSIFSSFLVADNSVVYSLNVLHKLIGFSSIRNNHQAIVWNGRAHKHQGLQQCPVDSP